MRCIKLGVGGERLAAGKLSIGFSSDNMLVTLCPSDCSWLLTSLFVKFSWDAQYNLSFLETFKTRYSKRQYQCQCLHHISSSEAVTHFRSNLFD